jgi:copper homeostasis protein
MSRARELPPRAQNHGVLVEVCVDSSQSLMAALAGCPHRIEVASALALGGLTPLAGLLTEVLKNLPADRRPEIVALVRPRPGDFVYDRPEVLHMLADVTFCASADADAVAVGCLKPDGSGGFDVDCETLAELVARAREHQVAVCFHRAFDLAKDPFKALNDIIRVGGVARVLTSGGGRCAAGEREAAMLAALVRRAKDAGIAIVAAGGVRADNVADIIRKTGVRQVHSSALASEPVQRDWQRQQLAAAAGERRGGGGGSGSSRGAGRDAPVLGSAGAQAQSEWFAVDTSQVRALVREAEAAVA